MPLGAKNRDTIRQTSNRMHHQLSIRGGDIHARTGGAGAPTIVFESGGAACSTEWDVIEPSVARFATTAVYDRRGTGKSSAVDGPRRLQDIVDDLEAVLDALSLPTPILLVGHSLGGLIARLYAARHPRRVLGLVLVDPTHELMPERFQAALSPAAFAVLREEFAVAPEGLNLVDELRLLSPMPALHCPLTVLSATTRSKLPASVPVSLAAELVAALDTIAPSLHRRLAASSSQGIYCAVENAGHHIHLERPDVVLKVIKAMISDVQSACSIGG